MQVVVGTGPEQGGHVRLVSAEAGIPESKLPSETTMLAPSRTAVALSQN